MRFPRSLFISALAIATLTPANGTPSFAAAREARTLKGHTGGITDVAFSPDGRTLASASTDKTVKLWDVMTGQLRTTLSGHSAAVSCVAFSPDGKTLASGGHDAQVILWDVAAAKVRANLSAHSPKVKCLAFSANGLHLASGGADATICLWDASTGQLETTLKGHARGVLCLAFAPDESTLASGSADQSVKLWNLPRGDEQTPAALQHRGKRGPIVSVTFSTDGEKLAMATSEFVAVWQLARPRRLFAVSAPRRASIYCARYSPWRTLLAVASGANSSRSNRFDVKKGPKQLKENEITLWDAATGLERGSLNGHYGPVRAIDFSPNGRLLASGSSDKTVMLWDLARYRERKSDPPFGEVAASASNESWVLSDDEPSGEYSNLGSLAADALSLLLGADKGAAGTSVRPRRTESSPAKSGGGSNSAWENARELHDRPARNVAEPSHSESNHTASSRFDEHGGAGHERDSVRAEKEENQQGK